jgi:hypothetical protein
VDRMILIDEPPERLVGAKGTGSDDLAHALLPDTKSRSGRSAASCYFASPSRKR